MFPIHYIESKIKLTEPPIVLSNKKAKTFNRKLRNRLRSYSPYQKEIRGSQIIEQYRNEAGYLDHERQPAQIITNLKTGLKTETWFKNGVLHRLDGPAQISLYPNEPNKGSRISYYQNGLLHRTKGPAKTIVDDQGDILEKFYIKGKLNSMHKKRGSVNKNSTPAIQLIHKGSPIIQKWYNQGRLDREGAPAVIINKNGIKTEEWWTDNRLNRIDGPARTIINSDGSSLMEYYRDGVRHREAGPAYINRKANGDVSQKWYNHGKLHRLDGPAVDVIRTDDNNLDKIP